MPSILLFDVNYTCINLFCFNFEDYCKFYLPNLPKNIINMIFNFKKNFMFVLGRIESSVTFLSWNFIINYF